MTSPTPAELHDVLTRLRERYVASSGATIRAFEALAERLSSDPTAPEVVEALRRELHRVHGTAGSYGFLEVSRLAGALELLAIRWTGDATFDRDRRGAVIRQFARALEAAFATAPGGRVAAQRLLLVELPEGVNVGLIAEAVHRGYFVEQCTADEATKQIELAPPRMVISRAGALRSVPDGLPTILLRAEGVVTEPLAGRVRLLAERTDAREVLDVAESLATLAGSAGSTLLVVDDDPVVLTLVRHLCEREGMFVETRTDAMELEARLDDWRPALVLMDIGLPGRSGTETTRVLRQDPRFADLPVILFSGTNDAATREAAFQSGADDFMSKPVVPDELFRRISRLLELHRQRQLGQGVHPATSLPLPVRTLRSLDERLAALTPRDAGVSIALVRPLEPPVGIQRGGRWHRECRQLAASLLGTDAVVGFADETALLVVSAESGEALEARLAPRATAAGGELSAWVAGLADTRRLPNRSSRDLVAAAEEAWVAARETGAVTRIWDEADADLAPDVIIVEDDPALCDMLTFALSARGLTHRIYQTGPGALEGLRSMRPGARPPIVLLDVDLPGLDGFSLFERIRVDRPGVYRVVFMSVHGSEGDQLRALRAGALDFLTKPVSLRVLMAKLTVWRDRGPTT